MPDTVSRCSVFSANSTLPTGSSRSLSYVGILLIKFVAMFAMSLSSVGSCDSHSAPKVLTASDRFQVIRIDAFSVSTQVINLKSVRDWSFGNFVRKSVSQMKNTSNLKLPIPTTVGAAGPFPASIVSNFVSGRELLHSLGIHGA